MNNTWSTKSEDMQVATQIIESYSPANDNALLGIFVLSFNVNKKQMSFKLADWVMELANYFFDRYGADQGDFVTRKVISCCIVNGQTLH